MKKNAEGVLKGCVKSIKVVCADCKYNFSLKENLKPMCPYCGGNRFMRNEDISAERLVNEASQF